MRILVTGSRTWANTRIIRDALARVWHPNNLLVHGGCPTGADALAQDCWTHWGGHVERHPTETVYQPCRDDCHHQLRRDRNGRPYCPVPPQRRNKHMVNLGADVCLAFIQSKSSGSIETARLARLAGIPVRLHRSGDGAFHIPHQTIRETPTCAPSLPHR